MWGLLNAYSRGECGDFASVQLRGDWERSIVRSIDGKMAEEKFRTAYKLLRIEKVDFFKKIFIRMLISEASQQPYRVLRKLKIVVFRSSNEPSQ